MLGLTLFHDFEENTEHIKCATKEHLRYWMDEKELNWSIAMNLKIYVKSLETKLKI